jgi:Asp-tRNA(Asn)/Glu-tRNA(Gln) amidotransferase C subunit
MLALMEEHQRTLRLAEAADLELPEERLEQVTAALAQLLALAAQLEQLALEGVEPAVGPQTWA